MTVYWVILGVLGLIVVWLIATYNGLITLRNRTDEAWSDIDVQLKRRYDLIPNLVETVKGYAGHEKEVFEKVTLARAAAGKPVVLEPLLEFFREKEYSGAFCPFLRDLELFPDGTLSFYPYPFLRTAAQRRAAAIGTARDGLVKRFRDCRPKAGSPGCAACVSSYYRLPGMSDGSRAHALRTAVCLEAARELIARSASEPAMKAYLKRLIGLFKKGYI